MSTYRCKLTLNILESKLMVFWDVVFMWLQTEYMVDMSCEGCVKNVKNKLQTVDGECYEFNMYRKTYFMWSVSYLTKLLLFFCVALGIKSVDVDLNNQVVRIFGSSPVKTMTEALEQTGRKARLIGQGLPGGWFWISFIFMFVAVDYYYYYYFILFVYSLSNEVVPIVIVHVLVSLNLVVSIWT